MDVEKAGFRIQESEVRNVTHSPLGERVAHDGAFISRRGSGEGVIVRYLQASEESTQMEFKALRRFFAALRMTVTR